MTELENVRRALAQAVEQAAGAAELARLLVDYQTRLDEAARSEAEALTRARDAEARLKTSEQQVAKLAKALAEQRYQTEVAQWRFESVQGSRWSQLGDAVQSKKPGRVAKTLRAPVDRRPAPKRADFKPELTAFEPAPPPVAPDPRAPQLSAPLSESFTVPKGPLVRPYLTVAGIVDRQSEALFRYEWRQVTNFGPDNWRQMLDEHQPHVLLVEPIRPGPRQGNGGRWLASLNMEDRALRDLVEECKRRGVKTIFWHSSGSVGKSVPVAELFETVLATSQPRAREWRAALRHDRVAILPHAVQPRVHNQIPAEGGRTPEILTLGSVEGVPWEALPGQQADKTTYDDLLTAYRRPALVVAGTFAEPRTIAEIEACGTPVHQVAGGPAADETQALLADPAALARRAHLSWRTTAPITPLLDPILEGAGVPSVRANGVITAVTTVTCEAELDHLLAQLARQARRPEQLVIVADGLDAQLIKKAAKLGAEAVQDLIVRELDAPLTRGAALDRALRLADGDLVAVLDPRDVYGEHYLSDLVRHFASTDADVVGKAAFYLQAAGATLLRQPAGEHRYLAELAGGTLLARRQVLTDLGFADVSEEWDEVLMRQCRADGIRVYSADRYSYVCVRDSAEGRLFSTATLEGYVAAEPLAMI